MKPRDEREKLMGAAVAETVEVGYNALSVNGIIGRARISKGTFYSHFSDKQAVVEAAYECLFEDYLSRLLQVCKTQSSWPLKVKVGIGLTLDMAAASPVEAQFVAAETLGADDEFRLRMLGSRVRLARVLAVGRTESPRGGELPEVLESALVGGICGVISTHLRAGEAKHLPALAPELVEVALTPYLGHEEAVEVARRPRPKFEG